MPSLFLIVVIDLIGFGIIIPLLPFYAEFYDASPTEVGLIMATYSFTQFLAAPFWGKLSDKIGRKPVLTFSLAGLSLSYVLLGLSQSLIFLFFARAIGGFMAGNISAAFAYVADITTKKNRAKGMGLIGAAFGVGFTLGPAIGGLLAGSDPVNADFKTPAFASAIFSGFALIITALFLKESLTLEVRKEQSKGKKNSTYKSLIAILSERALAIPLILVFLSTFAFAGLEATFAMWSKRQFGWGPEQNGYLFAFIGIFGALIQGTLINKLVKYYGEEILIKYGAISLLIGILMIPFSKSMLILMTAMIITTFGFSIISPSLNSLISINTSNKNQGEIMGVTRSISTLARFIGPAFAGLLFSFFGKNFPFYGGSMIMFIVLLICLFTKPLLKK